MDGEGRAGRRAGTYPQGFRSNTALVRAAGPCGAPPRPPRARQTNGKSARRPRCDSSARPRMPNSCHARMLACLISRPAVGAPRATPATVWSPTSASTAGRFTRRAPATFWRRPARGDRRGRPLRPQGRAGRLVAAGPGDRPRAAGRAAGVGARGRRGGGDVAARRLAPPRRWFRCVERGVVSG